MIRRLGIDLGTNNTRVWLPSQGIVVNEPTVVALDVTNNKILAVGRAAKEMLGRTPDSIAASHPMKGGVIASYREAETILKYFIDSLSGRIRLIRPEIIIAVPAGITSTERRAVVDATISAGARTAYLIKEPLAAALGAGISIASTVGNMVIDIGGGTSQVAVIALGDIVASSMVRIGGNKFDEAIANYIRKKHNLIIGEQTAEQIKAKIGAVIPPKKEKAMEVSGSNAISGLPESTIITTSDVVAAIRPPLNDIILAVKSVLQKTPPELASDVMDKGIVITGGSARLNELDRLFTKVTGVPCQVADDPELCVVKGTGLAVENLDSFKNSVLWAK